MTFGAKLRAIRKERKLNQAAFAEILGINATQVSGYESGKHNPRGKMIENIAEKLGVDVSILMDDTIGLDGQPDPILVARTDEIAVEAEESEGAAPAVLPDKIELLKAFAKGWFGNSQQHSIHAQMLRYRGYNKLAEKIQAESDEEWDEAKQVNYRLIELGVTPVVEIEAYPVISDVKEMLEYDCRDSVAALPMMSKSLALFDDDYVTRAMIQKFILDEQEHYNWVREHLSLIEDIGIKDYLIEQK